MYFEYLKFVFFLLKDVKHISKSEPSRNKRLQHRFVFNFAINSIKKHELGILLGVET